MDAMAASPPAVILAADVRQCLTCMRWVPADVHAMMPAGVNPMCALCLAVSKLQAAIVTSNLSAEREEAVHQALWRAYVLITHCGRGTPSRPYIPLGSQEEQSVSE